jgi:hypothetical protein
MALFGEAGVAARENRIFLLVVLLLSVSSGILLSEMV